MDLERDDFNEDGHFDAAMTCYSFAETPSEIIVALGDGTGEFELVHIPETTFLPSDITVADFNNDFHLDIAYDSADMNDFFAVTLGDGQGGFSPTEGFATGHSPGGIQAGDFDEDGNMDLVLASGYYGVPGSAAVHFGDGQGGFSEPLYFEVGVHPRELAVGDFNLDEHLDLAVVNTGSTLGTPDTVSILLGDGTGNFLSYGTHDVGDTPHYIITEDFNWDGNPDLAVAHEYYGAIGVLLGDGYGNFSEASFYDTGGGSGHLGAGDFNGDGILDIASFVQVGKVGVFYGDGTGSFPVMEEVRMGESPLPIAADFNEDGLDDILTGNFISGTFSLALGDGSGGFGEASYFDAGESTKRPQVADLNSDGWPDVVMVNLSGIPGYSPFCVLLNDGAGELLSPTSYDTSGVVSDVKVADMNEDGAQDLVLLDPHLDRLYVFLGDGLGGFSDQSHIDAANAVYFTAGDWNGDGHADVALANVIDFIDIYLGDGTGNLTLSEQIPACDGPQHIITDDLNDDGRADFVVNCLHAGDVVQIFLGDGQGSFVAGEIYEMPRDQSSIACIDLNEDGAMDITLCSPEGLYYLTGRGDGTFLEAQLFPGALSDWYPLSAGDLDGDGHRDLAVPSEIDDVEIHWGLGGGLYEPPVRYNAPLEPTASLVVDFNLDGKMDILATMKGFGSSGSLYSGVALFYGDGQRGFVDLN